MTKLKFLSAALLSSVLLVSALGFAFAQPDPDTKQPVPAVLKGDVNWVHIQLKAKDSDEAFIRRISKDLRGIEPTTTEVHFFVTSKEAKKREKLVDLFIVERKAKKKDADGSGSAPDVEALRAWEDAILKTAKVNPLSGTRKPQPSADLALLKTNVQLAQLAVEEKALLLKAAQDKHKNLTGDEAARNKTQIVLLQLDLRRAQLLLEQAELVLTAAQKKSPAK